MRNQLVLTVRFLQPFCHSRGEDGEPEWPPSPLRLLQALVSAAAALWNERQQLDYATTALRWLESLCPSTIVAPKGIVSDVRTQFFVPDNSAELLVPAWKKGEVDKAPKRTEKVVRRVHLRGDALHYVFPLSDGKCPHLEVLKSAARSITHLGWGIDMAVGDAAVLDAQQAAQLDGVRWRPTSAGGTPLRVPKIGTLDDLMRKHADFLTRVTDDGFRPVPPLRIFDVVNYRRESDPQPRPNAIFKLLDDADDPVAYPHAQLIHIAGMVRHAAIKLMTQNPPGNLREYSCEQWVDRYVAGHRSRTDNHNPWPHSQLSYVPLPSTGHPHANPAVRRVMIVAPPGDESWLEHLAQQLDGHLLEPQPETKFPGKVCLERIPSERRDGVRSAYTREAITWASFTPVILPGHDDHKPEKTNKLILKALAQSGIEQPCTFEWNAFSRFSKSYSAHKYDREKRPVGYIRPDHLLEQSAVHLVLKFDYPVPGPIIVGAGRHCGFGLFAAVD